ncbi:MAG: DNA-3-methyladenine glycosylase I [Candidatus Marinimicrobia bacterium]|nr:DNA-3-methyladenine glycosylase I [Candidatus Neomarinimicrobiota bacterium]
MTSNEIQRCGWVSKKENMIRYHDEEWGVPLFDDEKLFEFVILDGFQAGLSWEITLNKRENFRSAFNNFNPEKIALWDDKKIQELLQDTGIIRNKMKIKATQKNARAYLKIKESGVTFSEYLWKFTDGKTIQNHWESLKDIPVSTKESDAMSKALKKDGFTFVGTTICYAFMQAAGMVNDHLVSCFRYKEVQRRS